jgi:hypothetical protein
MANNNFIVQNGLNIGGAAGANISIDGTTGSLVFVPAATTAVPNPTATVFTPSGTVQSVPTVGGIATSANIASANAASATTLTNGTANVTVNSSNVTVGVGGTQVWTVAATGVTVAQNMTINANLTPANIAVNGSTGTNGQFLSSNGAGLTWVTLSSSSINSGASNVTVTAGNIFANVASTNIVGVNANGVLIAPQLTNTTYTSNTGTLSVGGSINYGPDFGLIGSFVANVPNYAYVAVQNLNTGGNASASFTAYNNTGTSYIDVGVNSSNFNAVSSGYVNNSLNTANASYAYAYGGDLAVGTWNNNGIHFITNAVTTVGDSMYIAGNGNVYISGNLTVSGNTSFVYTTTNFITESANLVQTAYLAGNATTNSGTITLVNNVIPTANLAVNLGSPTNYYGTIYAGQHTANTVTATSLGGTLTTASQPNITTLAGVTSIGASGSTTLTGTLQTASQTNITAVGTLTGLTVSGAIVPNGNLTVNLGSTSAWWNNIYGTAVHSLYADLAENYQADRQYNPGTVLMFGGPQEVIMADPDTTRVAGIVSTNPAHLMNGALNGGNVVPLALMGRVPCNVIGPVAKGDLMVSAGFGFAKTNNNASVGQVIGKALQDYPIAAKGVIEVVVGRV